jgi:tRNA modification GTPase
MTFDDTIAAIATPLGTGGLGVIRLSGPGALAVAARVFRSARPLDAVPSHTVVPGRVVDRDETLDQALASVFRSPRSYTGEDVVELSCHGGTALMKRVLEVCLKHGARLAEPGEFTRRAFLNGKIDLAQAEAVADLIAAQSDRFRRLAMNQLDGGLSRFVRKLKERTVDALAHLEAQLDFAEEEVPALSREDLNRNVEVLFRETTLLLETAPKGRVLRDGVRAALAGKPNVGKSSLFNALLNFDRAIVHDAPGTTRDTLEEKTLMGDVPVTLTDTAGLRSGGDPVESEGVRRARRALESADAVLFVVDASSPVSEEDREAARQVMGRKIFLALNKCDRLSGPPDRERVVSALTPLWGTVPAAMVEISATTGRGVNALRSAVAASFGINGAETGPVPTLVSARHEELARRAREAIENARRETAGRGNEECAAVDLRRALDCFNQILGEGVHDEVLHAVFSRFCIGK